MNAVDSGLAEIARAVEGALDALLPDGRGAERRLFEAMRYATLGGGKRLRPFLAVSAARLLGGPDARSLRVAAALEMIHCYSLVHDDLPAMDDDALRRGRPTCHIAFDEATAILAGDALLTLAFQIVAEPPTHPDGAVRAELALVLARAAGAAGMVGGQMTDIEAESRALDEPEIRRLQALKTGSLITCACEAGAIVAGACAADRTALRAYGAHLGAAFQIIDDILDASGSAVKMGKAVGKDAEAGKATLVAVLGLEAARADARREADAAIASLAGFGAGARSLREVAEFVVSRDH
ncbi:MAG: polyprenyl synthetase family protein [Alphaproteobacteria bacterium]